MCKKPIHSFCRMRKNVFDEDYWHSLKSNATPIVFMVFRWAVIVFLILHVIERVQWSASGQKWNIVMRIWNSIYSKTRLYRVSDRRFLSVFTTCNLGTWSEKSFRFNCQFFKSVFAITVVYCSKKRGYTHDMNLYI